MRAVGGGAGAGMREARTFLSANRPFRGSASTRNFVPFSTGVASIRPALNSINAAGAEAGFAAASCCRCKARIWHKSPALSESSSLCGTHQCGEVHALRLTALKIDA